MTSCVCPRPDICECPEGSLLMENTLLDRIDAHLTRLNQFPGTGSPDDLDKVLQEARAEIERLTGARAREAQGWISVEERLPEEGVRVLIAITEVQDLGTFNYVHVAAHRHGALWVDELERFSGVTHWQPLPEHPVLAAQPQPTPEREALERLVNLNNNPPTDYEERRRLGKEAWEQARAALAPAQAGER